MISITIFPPSYTIVHLTALRRRRRQTRGKSSSIAILHPPIQIQILLHRREPRTPLRIPRITTNFTSDLGPGLLLGILDVKHRLGSIHEPGEISTLVVLDALFVN